MSEETRRFYATDKEIYDVLASSKQRMTDAALLDMGSKRGIFYSPHESRDVLASNLSMLPFDYDSLAAVLGQSENPNRAEKVTSITLKTDIGTEAIKAAVNKFRDTAPSDEKVTSHAESATKYVMQVRYSELDPSKTRLLQRRTREANIRFVVENNALTIRMPATPKARSIAAAIKNELDAAAKSDIPAALCANMRETSTPSTITVGRGKKSHFDEHKPDKYSFRCADRVPSARTRFRGDRPSPPAQLHRRI